MLQFGKEKNCMGNVITTIFVCSPYQAQSKEPAVAKEQLEANMERVCLILVKLGYLPLALHLYFTSFLNDSDAEASRYSR